MIILQSAQSDFVDLGFDPHQLTTQNSIFNRKTVFAIFILILAIILSSACIFYDENTFQEYTAPVYLSTSYMLATATFAIFLWKSRMVFKFMHNAEKIVNEREL